MLKAAARIDKTSGKKASKKTGQASWPFAGYFAVALLAVIAGLLIQHWDNTGRALFDTDDAMRLVQMRDWLAGQGWFDLSQKRMALPYESHWSRLVDAGLAGVYSLFRMFAAPDTAERLLRAIWPLAFIAPTLGGMAAIAWRFAGREAALLALLFAVAGVPAYQQFSPGRIDHHNVQIAVAILTLAATVWSDRVRWCAAAAGALTALGLAIGFEALPYLAVCGAAFALRYVFDAKASVMLRDYAIALGACVLAAFFVSVGPAHWTRSLCDNLAFNSTVAVFAGSAVLALASAFPSRNIVIRAAGIGLAAAASLTALIATEPRCLAGPYAMVDPAIWPIWLADVRENQPLIRVLSENPLTGAAIAAFPAAALVATLMLMREETMRRQFAFLAAAAVFLVAVATMILAIRAYSYAMWLGMPLMAAGGLKLFAALHLTTLRARLIAGVFLTPLALSSGAITVAVAAGFEDKNSFIRADSAQCFRNDAYAQLAQLPPGLVIGDVSYGPFVLALTPHTIMSAPYHRFSSGILAAHRALAAPPEDARTLLTQMGAAYVVICGPRPPAGLAEPARGASLWAALAAGRVPAWLELVSGKGEAFSVYRLRKATASEAPRRTNAKS
jgi:hypothetical protein